MIKNFLILFFLMMGVAGKSQDSMVQPEMADGLRSDGKIYIVIAVIVLIFIALACFMFYIEKKIRKLEEKMDQHGKVQDKK
jgi:uncharacterized membrane protein